MGEGEVLSAKTRRDRHRRSASPIPLLAVLALVFAIGCGGSGDSTQAPSPGTGEGAAPAASPEATAAPSPDAAGVAADAGTGGAAEPKVDTRQEEYRKRRDACCSLEDHEILARWCETQGFAEGARREWDRIRRLDPENLTANTRLGYVKYQVPDEIAFSSIYRGELRKYNDRWQSPEAIERIRAEEEELRRRQAEDDAKAQADPWYADARRVALNKRGHPILKEFDLVAAFHEPYVVFVEARSEGDEKEIASRMGEFLVGLHAKFREIFEGRIAAEGGEGVLPVILFAKREGFDRYHKVFEKVGFEHNDLPDRTVRALYQPKSREVFGYLLDESDDPKQVFAGCLTAVLEAAGEQLLHGACAPGQETKALWFQRGAAAYLAPPYPGEPVEAGRLAFGSIHREKVQQVYDRISGDRIFPLFDLVGFLDEERMRSDASTRFGEEMENDPDAIADLFAAQAWLVTSFFLDGADGKYRTPYLDYAAEEFRGEGGRPAFRKCFDAKLREDYAPIEDALLEYLRQLFFAQEE